MKDRNFDFPKDVISLGGRVEYSCDRYYRLDGNDTETCLLDKLNKPLNTPRCLEGTAGTPAVKSQIPLYTQTIKKNMLLSFPSYPGSGASLSVRAPDS